MGNTGSLHEMHANCQGDLASYYHNSRAGIDRSDVAIKKYQQDSSLSSPIINYERPVSSETGDWRKSFPRTTKRTNSTNETPSLTHLKVLPHLSESLKLRTTANGTILHAGGTISGRREYQQLEAGLDARLHQPMLMQRSHTLICERGGGGPKQQNTVSSTDYDNTQPGSGIQVLRRAQSQFHLHFKGTRQQQQQLNKNEPQNHLAAAESNTTSRSEPDLRHNPAAKHTFDTTATPPITNRSSKNAKANKYNKKRKAPAAPNVITASTSASNANAKSLFVTTSSINNRRQTITINNNSNASQKGVDVVNKKTQTSTTATANSSHPKNLLVPATAEQTVGKSRIFLTKAEINSNIAGQRNFLEQKKLVSPVVQQLPYRREKSFDATLLYERTPHSIVAENLQKQHLAAATLLHQQKQPMKNEKREHTKIPILHHKRTFYFGMDIRRAAETATTETATKLTVPFENCTKLPSLVLREHTDKQDLHTGHSPIISSSSESIERTIEDYDISLNSKQCEDDNDSNGLQVHVRPMLPRRQMSIPRFSPAAAWRMLTEERQNLQLQRQSMKTQASTAQHQQQAFSPTAVTRTIDTSSNSEHPIQPVCKAFNKFRPTALVLATAVDASGPGKKLTSKPYATTPWTPQQDLEDDDDDDDHSSSDEFATKTNINHANSLFLVESSSNIAATGTAGTNNFKNPSGNAAAAVHVFSLSLPRDGHFGIGENKPLNEKKSGFSSLQKLKRTVSGGNCGCIQTKYTDQVTEQILGTDEFNTNYDDAVVTTSGGTLRENTSDNNVQSTSFSNGYRSDNWVLSKTKFGVIGNHGTFHTTTKANFPTATNPMKSSQRWNTLVSIEPVSLSYLTAGKHVMYLPGHNTLTNNSHSNKITATLNEDNKCKEVKLKQNQKTKSRKKESHTRQSLQDPIPLGISSSQNKYTTKRDLPGERSFLQNEKQQRFSFQSTVRLIEKRRLAEKLSKDAEIKEEKRRSELEAMKRVEEDFRRKRASEKATIRQQLRLVSNLDSFNNQMNQFQSSPMKLKHNQEDSNNNVYYRADPDGAISSPSNSPVLQYAHDSENVGFKSKPFDFNETSTEYFQIQNRNSDINIENNILEFQRTASLVKPYLQSIVK